MIRLKQNFNLEHRTVLLTLMLTVLLFFQRQSELFYSVFEINQNCSACNTKIDINNYKKDRTVCKSVTLKIKEKIIKTP